MKEDPVIERIREARRRISEACGHDPTRVVAYYIERQQQHRDRLVTDEAGDTAPPSDTKEEAD